MHARPGLQPWINAHPARAHTPLHSPTQPFLNRQPYSTYGMSALRPLGYAAPNVVRYQRWCVSARGRKVDRPKSAQAKEGQLQQASA